MAKKLAKPDLEAARQAKATKRIFGNLARTIAGMISTKIDYMDIKGTDVISVLLKDPEDHDELLEELDHEYELTNNKLIYNDDVVNSIDVMTVDQVVAAVEKAIADEKFDAAHLVATQEARRTKRKLPEGVTEVEVGGKVTKLGAPKPSKKPKPTISKFFDAFFKYNARVQQIARSESIRNPAKWQVHMDAAQAEFKAELEGLGLAEHIDWTNTDA